jgi:hypothetical protein
VLRTRPIQPVVVEPLTVGERGVAQARQAALGEQSRDVLGPVLEAGQGHAIGEAVDERTVAACEGVQRLLYGQWLPMDTHTFAW